MNSKSKLAVYYSVALVTILIGAISVRLLILKANLPFPSETLEGKIVSSNSWETINEKSIIESIDDIPIISDFQLEFILDSKNIGDKVTVVSNYGGMQNRVEVTLLPFYGYSFIVISILISITFFLSGLFVISKRHNDSFAQMLFWILLLFGLATVTSPGKFYTGTDILSIITRISHSISYAFGIAAFLHFSFRFPVKKELTRFLPLLIYVPSTLFALLVSAALAVSMTALNNDWIRLYDILWMLLQSVLSISIILGLYNFFSAYRKLRKSEDKHKVQWVLWGITAGVLPYLILFVIPTVLEFRILIPEEYSMLPLILIPVSFVIAVFKYHIFDIEIIINRSIVYSILTGFIILLYFAIVIAGSSLFNEFAGNVDRLTSLIAVFIIAFFLNPARIRIHKFVNRTFYREKYDFEQALRSFSKIVSECSTSGQLGQRTVKEIKTLIPVDKIGMFLTNEAYSRLRVLAQINMDEAVKNLNALRVKQIKSGFDKPFALQENIQQGIEIDPSLTEILKRWDLCLIIPLKLGTDFVIGGIALGKKLSGLKYSQHDIDLLGVIATETAAALKRLQLQEELIVKELENQKLEELNSLKSFFVSSVTHDLKTPLTSIRMFAEMLRTKEDSSGKKRKEYLSIIEGESDRLAQLIDNVLVYSKIESGVQQYNFDCCNLNNLVTEVLDFMNYQFKINNFELITCLDKEKLLITADKSAVQSVLVNLLSNAIKYSNDIKKIKISTGKDKEFTFVTVEDNGIGIPEQDIDNIFEPFFRSKKQGLSKTNGTGLGLAIVKYIIEYHKGKIEVTSALGKGSIFKLFFPLNEPEINPKII